MNILTFDIEDWFHILDNEASRTEKQWLNFESRLEQNIEKIFNLLNKHDQKATFFVIGWVARKYPHIVKKIDELGYEIATHSDMHQLAYEFNKKEFRNDLELSIKSIEDITGKKVRIYRAPGFSIKKENLWAFDELIMQGIEIDCSIFPAKRSHGGLEEFGHAEPAYIEVESGKLKAFPINLYRTFGQDLVFSGGGYFRLFPYQVIKYMMKRSKYVMTYLHPRDFDPGQPILEGLNAIRKFKSYYGLSKSYNKLDILINDFKFIDINEANRKIDWNNVKTISLKN